MVVNWPKNFGEGALELSRDDFIYHDLSRAKPKNNGKVMEFFFQKAHGKRR